MYSNAFVIKFVRLDIFKLKNVLVERMKQKYIITYTNDGKTKGKIEGNNSLSKFIRINNFIVLFANEEKMIEVLKEAVLMVNATNTELIKYKNDWRKDGYPSSAIVNYEFGEEEGFYETVVGNNEYTVYFQKNGKFTFNYVSEIEEIAQLIYEIAVNEINHQR